MIYTRVGFVCAIGVGCYLFPCQRIIDGAKALLIDDLRRKDLFSLPQNHLGKIFLYEK